MVKEEWSCGQTNLILVLTSGYIYSLGSLSVSFIRATLIARLDSHLVLTVSFAYDSGVGIVCLAISKYLRRS